LEAAEKFGYFDFLPVSKKGEFMEINVLVFILFIIFCLLMGYCICYIRNKSYVDYLYARCVELSKKENMFLSKENENTQAENQLMKLKPQYQRLQSDFLELETKYNTLIRYINDWDLNQISKYRTE